MDRSDPITAEQKFNESPDEVWSAITDIDKMVKWYFDNIPDFKPEVGFTTRFNVKAPSRDFLHIWTITEVEPGKRITYSWEFEGIEGYGTSTFEITETEGGSILRLIAEGMDTFPEEYPEFTRESCQAGWNYFINERLPEYFK